jgi:hypothetical protein
MQYSICVIVKYFQFFGKHCWTLQLWRLAVPVFWILALCHTLGVAVIQNIDTKQQECSLLHVNYRENRGIGFIEGTKWKENSVNRYKYLSRNFNLQTNKTYTIFNAYDLQYSCWTHLITRQQIIIQKYKMKIKRKKFHMNSGLQVANRMNISE